jgi:hypothetical protein
VKLIIKRRVSGILIIIKWIVSSNLFAGHPRDLGVEVEGDLVDHLHLDEKFYGHSSVNILA